MRWRFFTAWQTVALICLTARLSRADPFPEANVCGPRAVVDVLKAYAKKATVGDLLLRNPADRPWSLQDVCDALNEHDVFARCIQVNQPRQLQWSGPVILHLESSSDATVGHFVVLFPNAPNPSTPILDGAEWRPWSAVNDRLSGRAVVTARTHRDYLLESSMYYVSVLIVVSGLAGVAASVTKGLFRTSTPTDNKSGHWHGLPILRRRKDIS